MNTTTASAADTTTNRGFTVSEYLGSRRLSEALNEIIDVNAPATPALTGAYGVDLAQTKANQAACSMAQSARLAFQMARRGTDAAKLAAAKRFVIEAHAACGIPTR